MDAASPHRTPTFERQPDGLEVCACETARDMLSVLSFGNDLWIDPQRPTYGSEWVFRGQSDARWSLTPSALRAGNRVIAAHINRLNAEFERVLLRVEDRLTSDLLPPDMRKIMVKRMPEVNIMVADEIINVMKGHEAWKQRANLARALGQPILHPVQVKQLEKLFHNGQIAMRIARGERLPHYEYRWLPEQRSREAVVMHIFTEYYGGTWCSLYDISAALGYKDADSLSARDREILISLLNAGKIEQRYDEVLRSTLYRARPAEALEEETQDAQPAS